MELAIISGVIVAGLIILTILKVRQKQIPDTNDSESLSSYNRECRSVKLDYRDGKLSVEEAMAKLEEIGDKYRIPHQRRTKSIGATQVRKI